MERMGKYLVFDTLMTTELSEGVEELGNTPTAEETELMNIPPEDKARTMRTTVILPISDVAHVHISANPEYNKVVTHNEYGFMTRASLGKIVGLLNELEGAK